MLPDMLSLGGGQGGDESPEEECFLSHLVDHINDTFGYLNFAVEQVTRACPPPIVGRVACVVMQCWGRRNGFEGQRYFVERGQTVSTAWYLNTFLLTHTSRAFRILLQLAGMTDFGAKFDFLERERGPLASYSASLVYARGMAVREQGGDDRWLHCLFVC